MTIAAILALVTQFIPVVNVATDLIGTIGGTAEAPHLWVFALKAAESVAFLQILMPWLERFTRSTANTWDDGIVAKAKMVLAFTIEILGALGAFDPKLGKRIKAITGPRED